jgi:Ser/Thr protein kinase RdoA (MazF antagonist)
MTGRAGRTSLSWYLSAVLTDFFSLTPERVLDAVEQSGHGTTGLCYALNSLENRVYEVELEGGRRLVAKFYRPGRWSREAILDEHTLLAALVEAEIPVCAPDPFPDGSTLKSTPEGILFTLFPRVGGRSPDELVAADHLELGRLLGRIHNVTASLKLSHRPVIGPDMYGGDSLALILDKAAMSPVVRKSFADVAGQLIEAGRRMWQGVPTFVVHGDCHRANLLRARERWMFLDFDDCGRAPAVQDMWLLLPAPVAGCPAEVEALLEGYEQFRRFEHGTLRLVEVLRGLRYLRYAAWILARREDPSFTRAFPSFGTEVYWEGQLGDLREQLGRVQQW